jgi:hypothetical protein
MFIFVVQREDAAAFAYNDPSDPALGRAVCWVQLPNGGSLCYNYVIQRPLSR